MSDYIDIDALSPKAYEEDDYIVINDPTAYNPFTGLLNIDQLESSSPAPSPAQHYIYIGDIDTPTLFFDPTNLVSVNSNTGIDPIGNELTIDTLEFEVYWEDDGTLAGLTYATPIWCYRGSAFVGKFYFKTIERYGTNHWKVSAVSVIGLLEYEPHYGGMYNALSAKTAISDAFLGNGLDVSDYQRYSSVRSTTTVTSVPLAQNCVGASAAVSGTGSTIVINFSVYSATYNSEQPIWKTVADEYGTAEDVYVAGVTVKKTSSSSGDNGITVSIYCAYGNSLSPSPVHTFTASYGDNIIVYILQRDGYGYVLVNGTMTALYEFTSLTENLIMPLYSSVGLLYANGTITYQTTTLDYELKALVIGEYMTSGVGLEVYFLKNTGSGDIYFYNRISEYSHIVSGYTTVGDSYPAETDALAELYDIVENIQWPENINSLTVSGLVQAGTKREVLHQLLFALNLNLFKSSDGNIIINQLPAEVDKEIDEDETYNKGSTEEVSSVRYIELTEHSYTASGETQTVFDNSGATVGNEDYTILFDTTIYGNPTAGTGITIKHFNANAAVVSGKGAITAQTLLHSQRVIKQAVSSRPDGGTASITGATMVTFLNSSSVMNKLLAYYNNGCYKTKNSILTNAMCGRRYQFPSPFGGGSSITRGYLIGANSVGSAVTKTNCTFLSNFTPVSIGNDYNNFVILTGSGTFSLPSGATKLHVVMIGGGNGGASGYAGANGGSNSNFSSSSPASGGNFGSNGASGKVYEVEISSPSSSYSYACGTGGSGGAKCTSTSQNNAGSAGTASTFGTYSSASGSSKRYTNILNGDLLAGSMPMWDDQRGKGGNGGAKTISNDHKTVTQTQAKDAYNFMTGITHFGGASPLGASLNGVYQWVGGSGGGAALTQDGSRGGDYATIGGQQVISANGGKGADATYVPPKATDYNPKYFGYGGMGGCGGGGGGSAGYDGQEQTSFTPGTGGYGGKGGDGGDGCIIVYY